MVDAIARAGEFERGAQKSSPFAIASSINGTASLRRRGVNSDAVVGEHGTDLVGNGCDQPQQELLSIRRWRRFSCSST